MSWEIDWFICRADAKDVEWQATRHLKKGETRRVLSVGDELWRVPRAIGPLMIDHDHWSGYHLTCTPEEALVASAAPNMLEALQAFLAEFDQAALVESDHPHAKFAPAARLALAAVTLTEDHTDV